MKQARGESGRIKSPLFSRLSAPLRKFARFAARIRRSAGKRIAELREVFVRIAVRLPWNGRLRREWRLIRKSRLMDAGWYFAHYPAARRGKPDPVLHYLRVGALKGWDPNPLFSGRWYLDQSPDVANAGQNPLVHYLMAGASEGRDPHPFFLGRWYLEQNPDIAEAGQNPLIHYLTVGANEGRDPHPLFDTDWYLSRNPDVAALGLNPFAHYAECGWKEGREPRPHFDGNYDLSQNPEVAGSRASLLKQMVPMKGGWQGRIEKVSLAHHPKISVVMPVHRTPLPLLERAVMSVTDQEYSRWEICIADDGSNDEAIQEWLETRARDESRIHLAINKNNRGISAATNDAISLCTGDFVALLDHDDELTPDALGEIAAYLAEHPETDVVYSDQDKMDEAGRCYEPFHKPAWSPVLFLGVMYVGHLLVIRRTILERVGGCDARFDKVQDYELMLRVSEVTDRIRHIPKILYHWRAVAGSLAASTSAKTSIEELQVSAVAAHLKRLGVAAEARSHPRHAHRVLLEAADGHPQPRISIIIPSAADSPLLADCLTSIVEKTKYAEYEILLMVRKGANRTEIQSSNLAMAQNLAKVRLMEYDFPFNYSRVNNYAASMADGSLLVFLNDDTRVITPDWLDIMLTHLSLPGVGAVGPKLLFPDGSVQHAGVVLGFRGTADHVMRGYPSDADGYFGSLSASREVSAVTAACLMTRAVTYQCVGGMTECFASIYQDVDLCLKIGQLGLSLVYVANAELVHYESTTRGTDYNRVDREILIDRWREKLIQDPYYNQHFSLERHDYTLKAPQT